MNSDEKITSVQTDENRSDVPGDSTAEPSVLPEMSPQAQNQPQDQALLNVQSTLASSQGVKSNSSEIINASQELKLQTGKQMPANPPQSSSQYAASNLENVELKIDSTLISSEPNIQFVNQPPASQSVSQLCADDKCSIQSDFVEIQISPQNESHIEQQFKHSEAENRAKEDKNITIRRAEDAIEELSDALPSPTNPSSSGDKKEDKDSCMKKFLKSRMQIAKGQLNRADYVLLLIVSLLVEVLYPAIYCSIKTDGGYDIFLSVLITIPICWVIAFFMDRNLLTEKFYSTFPCFKRYDVKPVVKKSQHAPSVEQNAAFQHEVANVEDTSPQDSPHIFERTEDSLYSGSTDQASELPGNTDAFFNKLNANISEYEGARGYSPAFSSGACGYSPGLGEGSIYPHFTDLSSESHVVVNVEVHKANNDSAEELAEAESQLVLNVEVHKANNDSAEELAEAESQLVLNVDVHKEHERSENPAEAASGCGHSSGLGGEKTSHDL